MVTIKVFDSAGVKTLQALDNLAEVPYDVPDEEVDEFINQFAEEQEED